jgi:arylsulfatase A-like enzyme
MQNNTVKFTLLFIAIIFLSCKQEENAQPNFVLVMCDDLGWGDTGFNGNTVISTPNLDAMAGAGVKFNRFYSASAVCSPTRASCITGRNPYRMGIPGANNGHMLPEEITIAELLKERGYATGHFGKWHLGTLTTKIKDANRGRPGDFSHYSLPSMNGFDEYFATESKVPTFDPLIKPDSFSKEKGEGLRYGWAAVEDESRAKDFGTHYWNGEESMVTDNLEGDDSRVIMDRAIPFIEKSVKVGKSFFTVIWFHTPHLPVVADKKLREKYKDLSHELQLYYGTISAMDKQMGRLKDKLEELGVLDNTVIFFTSDNGPEKGTPGSSGIFRERKRSLYEGGVRVPSFCMWPDKVKAGQATDVPCVTSDYLPTILDIIGMDYPDDRPLDGISILPVIKEDQNARNSSIGFRFQQKTSWVNDMYKLISVDGGKSYELYDLINDKSEKNNIAAYYPDMVNGMKAELLGWIESCDNSSKGKDF